MSPATASPIAAGRSFLLLAMTTLVVALLADPAGAAGPSPAVAGLRGFAHADGSRTYTARAARSATHVVICDLRPVRCRDAVRMRARRWTIDLPATRDGLTQFDLGAHPALPEDPAPVVGAPGASFHAVVFAFDRGRVTRRDVRGVLERPIGTALPAGR